MASVCLQRTLKLKLLWNNGITYKFPLHAENAVRSALRCMCATAESSTPDITLLEKELTEKVQLLTEECKELKDKYQRTLADRENVRMRLQKEISDAKIFAIQGFCKDLLEVSDVFKTAIESVPKASIKEGDSVFTNLYDGVVMTENMLQKVFIRHGLEQFLPKKGDKFDPSLQEAVFEMPLEQGDEPGNVSIVLRSGWKLHNRCIRTSQVGVTKSL